MLKTAPDHPAANNNLAYVYHLTGASDQAVFHYQKVLHYKPDHQAAQHMLAALTGAVQRVRRSPMSGMSSIIIPAL